MVSSDRLCCQDPPGALLDSARARRSRRTAASAAGCRRRRRGRLTRATIAAAVSQSGHSARWAASIHDGGESLAIVTDALAATAAAGWISSDALTASCPSMHRRGHRRLRRDRVVGGGLQHEQCGVDTVGGHELVVAAVFDDAPAGDDVDVVGFADRFVPVGDEQDGAPGADSADAAEQVMFGAWVQRGGRLVENDQRGVADERTRLGARERWRQGR